MSIRERREREQAERERLIVTAARELAESEGWDAVTTRRLAAEIEYSQPVLYSHFKGKVAIMTAVALDGFADEDIDYAVRLRHAGVPTELHVYPGAPHGFDGLAPGTAIARRANRDIEEWLATALRV